ncbi:histidinol-phosphatase (PHP family) [Nocardioides aurantiacus]|uniref:Histidinol-phosphatase n=2 Tax=Nocardioides aurantiacus TaxID=86796 RepID=A0A3N2CTV5_9ACTN|nr:histidinol-phosphatase (PHP family) [Nocardioides aurantiacus]
MLPPDSHVHTEWSWDAPYGSMERTCARAIELGLPSVAFTEHADMTGWVTPQDAQRPPAWDRFVTGGVLVPPPIDLQGYNASLERCRERYPGLRIYSGVELSEPHWHSERSSSLLQAGEFERVLASVHSARRATGSGFEEVSSSFADHTPDQVVRDYLDETVRLVEQFDNFEVLAHIDYPVRYWPGHDRPYDPLNFEDQYRHVLRVLASADKVLELNTKVPLHPQILLWWHQEGGQAITFASDAHDPESLAHGFVEAVRTAQAAGFRPGPDPLGVWRRT